MDLKSAFGNLYGDAKEKYNIQQAPKLILKHDNENAQKIFGRTAYYVPETKTIVLYMQHQSLRCGRVHYSFNPILSLYSSCKSGLPLPPDPSTPKLHDANSTRRKIQ